MEIALEVVPTQPQLSMIIQTKSQDVEWIVLKLKLMAAIAQGFQMVKWMACYYIFVFLKSRIEIGLDWKTSVTHVELYNLWVGDTSNYRSPCLWHFLLEINLKFKKYMLFLVWPSILRLWLRPPFFHTPLFPTTLLGL